MDRKWAQQIAERIAHGHAFANHVLNADEFPEIRTREEFAALIFQILTDPMSLRKDLERDREGYWSGVQQVVVIVDELSEDGGTAFRPQRGVAYFRTMR